MGLLKKCFLSDQLLSPEEGQELRALLLSASEEGQTRETVFQKNQEGYARFAYEMGLAYFYKCPRETEKRYAGVYLKAAAEAEKGLSPVQRERAGKLGAIADYYEQIGQVDPAGDMQVGWKDYWADLLRVSQGNLVAEDNERTAIVVYREELYQLLAHYPELQKAGIPAGALRLEAERVRTHLDTDFEMLEETRKQGVESELTEPVSYTHLDVYKRQADGGACALGEIGAFNDIEDYMTICHEGSSAASLAESIDRVVSNPSGDMGSFIGVPLKAMKKVTFCDMQGSAGTYQLMIATGETLPVSHQEWVDGGEKLVLKLRADGVKASQVIDQMIKAGLHHHVVIKEGDYTELLKMICGYMDIDEMLLK